MACHGIVNSHFMTFRFGEIRLGHPCEVDSRSTAISANVPGTNGLLHVVDTVLLPAGAVVWSTNRLENK